MITDERLLHNYRLGSMSAFEELYRRHRPRVFHLLQRYFSNGAILEQIHQQVFKRFHEHRNSLKPHHTVLQYIFVITRNEIAHELKRTGGFKSNDWLVEEVLPPHKIEAESNFKTILENESRDLTDAKLLHLHGKFSDGLAVEEIASSIGWPFYNGHWQTDWQIFNESQPRAEISLFGSLRLRIQSDLYRLSPKIFFRFVFFYLAGGILAWSVCPQMDVSLFSFQGMGWLFKKFGHGFNIFLSAAFFETVALWSVGLFLTAEQEIIVATRRASLICVLIILAFFMIFPFTHDPYWTVPTLWVAGALFAAIAQASLLFPISQS